MKYVLGGGIAGLIAAFYNKSHVVITDKVGGQMAAGNLGPRILEANANSQRLLLDLGYDFVPTKTARIGCKVGPDFVSMRNLWRAEYYRKSRCLPADCQDIPESSMSDGKDEITYYDIDWSDLIHRLTNAIGEDRFEIGKLNRIIPQLNAMSVEVSGENVVVPYEHLISTISATVFYEAASYFAIPEEPLVAIPKVFITIPVEYAWIGEYEYVYYPSNIEPYHRITRLENGMAAVEYTTHTPVEELKKQWRDFWVNAAYIPNGQIQSGKVGKIDGIEFVGRYACWNHDIKTDDVVEQSIKIMESDING